MFTIFPRLAPVGRKDIQEFSTVLRQVLGQDYIGWTLYLFAVAAVAKYHRLGLSSRDLFTHSSGG